MKYTSKNQYYESPNGNQGIFENPWAETTMPKKWIDENGYDNFAMNFSLFHSKNGVTGGRSVVCKVFFNGTNWIT